MSKVSHSLTKTTTVATVHSEMLPDSSTKCQLVVVDGPDMGRAVPIEGAPVCVGTSSTCDLVLTDQRVSAAHLRLTREQEWFVAEDLESRNGTMFQGSLISTSRVIVGATFKLGHSYVRIQPRPQHLEVPPSQSRRFGELVGESLAMREVFGVLELVAEGEVTVLIEGETGTGKELVARAIHEASERRKRPFVAIDCGALPATLLESELFGHTKGAFTGAESAREGAFIRASGGTLFLDELGHIPLDAQARLLRALEERKVRPLGADREEPVDVRILAASQVDLDTRMAEGSFRPDLFYRLSVVRIKLPALRERREDIAPIVSAMLAHRGFPSSSIKGPNLDRLMAHDWQGNVRELRNMIDRAVALSPGATTFAQLRLSLRPSSQAGFPLSVRTDLPYSEAKQRLLQVFEETYLRDVFERVDGNISAMAREVQLDRKHLRSLLRRNGILPE